MTEGFRGYTCWAPDRVNDTIVVDAVNSSPAVFLATHRPSQMLRRDFAATSGGTLIDEEQLLREFLAPQFAKWWLPDRFEFLPEIPKTAVGKFRKTALREQFAQAPVAS